MINKQEVQHIAKLARLNMNKQEEEKFTKELSSILDYVEKLKKVDVKNVKPTSHPFEIENIIRNDVSQKSEEKLVEKLIKAAPAQTKNYIKVKTILKNSK